MKEMPIRSWITVLNHVGIYNYNLDTNFKFIFKLHAIIYWTCNAILN